MTDPQTFSIFVDLNSFEESLSGILWDACYWNLPGGFLIGGLVLLVWGKHG